MLCGNGNDVLRGGKVRTECWVLASSAEVNMNRLFLWVVKRIIHCKVGKNEFVLIRVCCMLNMTRNC